MRVLILSQHGIAKALTGDNTQMRKTVAGIRPLVEEVTHIYVAGDGSLFDETDAPVPESLQSLCLRHDVVHQIPRLSFRVHRVVQEVLASRPVLLSTVFWYDSTRVRMAWQNEAGFTTRILTAARVWRIGAKSLLDYRRGCDVLLPNSWAEGENARHYFRLAPHVAVMPIPNAVELPLFDVQGLEKPKEIPFGEYMVCPAAFALRKNQLGLIKALRGCDIPIVFMGNPLASARRYWAECQRLATPNMCFLEHRENGGVDFWAVLRHARCACLPSDCETPGIALLEAAVAGARPIITHHGGTPEYYGFCAEYLDPANAESIQSAVARGWARGRLAPDESRSFERFSWKWAAELTVEAYQCAIKLHRTHANG